MDGVYTTIKLCCTSSWLFFLRGRCPAWLHLAQIVGNLRSYLGLSFEEAQGQAALAVEEVCRFKIQLDLVLNFLKKTQKPKKANKQKILKWASSLVQWGGEVKESQNHKMFWVARDLQDHLIQLPATCRDQLAKSARSWEQDHAFAKTFVFETS